MNNESINFKKKYKEQLRECSIDLKNEYNKLKIIKNDTKIDHKNKNMHMVEIASMIMHIEFCIYRLKHNLNVIHKKNNTQEKWDYRKLKKSIKCDVKLKRSRL